MCYWVGHSFLVTNQSPQKLVTGQGTVVLVTNQRPQKSVTGQGRVGLSHQSEPTEISYRAQPVPSITSQKSLKSYTQCRIDLDVLSVANQNS